jgi:hypothetical protein
MAVKCSDLGDDGVAVDGFHSPRYSFERPFSPNIIPNC